MSSSAMRTSVPMVRGSIKVRQRGRRNARFARLHGRLKEGPAVPRTVSDISTTIAGMKLRNPTMLASGFLDETGGTLLRVFKAGAGAVVTKSIGPAPGGGNTTPTNVELEVAMVNAMGLRHPALTDLGPEAE